jgi:hypothetical protein
MASVSAVDIETQLIELVRDLPPARAAEVLDFAAFLHARGGERGSDVRTALAESFGVWRDRADLVGDSANLVRAMRTEWEEREQRLELG